MKIEASLRHPAPWLGPLAVTAAVRLVFYLRLLPCTMVVDSMSYFEFPLVWQGSPIPRIVNGRVPLYPLLLRIANRIFRDGGGGTYKYLFIVFVQQAVSLACVAVFYQTCRMLVRSRAVLFAATVLYGCAPAVCGWDTVILTESLALSGTVCFLYLMVRWLRCPGFGCGAAAAALLLVLTFLRPSFLLFDGLLLGFWVLRLLLEKQHRALTAKLLCCSLAGFVVIAGYAAVFQRSFGFFSISDPMPRQIAYVCVDRGYYTQSDDPEFIAAVEAALADDPAHPGDTWHAVGLLLDRYGLPGTAQRCRACIQNDLPGYAADTLQLAGSLAPQRFSGYYELRPQEELSPALRLAGDTAAALFDLPRVWLLYLVLAGQLIALLVLWVRRRRLPWVHLGLFAFPLLILVSSLAATCDEYPRTMICVLPFMYCSLTLFAGRLADFFRQKFIRA